MIPNPYRVLETKRFGGTLAREQIEAVAEGAASGSWSDAQLGAFLMAVAIHGLDQRETRDLTRAMLESGERWRLADDLPEVVDKHSTGGVGDKVSLILGPLLAACDVPVVMLTGRSLGHTGGTADKLESIPGLDLALDRMRALDLLENCRLAIGIATADVAPADRTLYRLRDATGTVSSMPLVVGSILSKKLATGAGAITFDCKTGSGAFFSEPNVAAELGRALVETSTALGCRASALVTDMSQPLGHWVGHTAEVQESLRCLSEGAAILSSGEADGPERQLIDVALRLSESVCEVAENGVTREDLIGAMASGRARECFLAWAAAQGADAAWLAQPDFTLAQQELVVEAQESGWLNEIDTKQLGLLFSETCRPGGRIDPTVSLRVEAALGREVTTGEELARLYVGESSKVDCDAFRACFVIGEERSAPPPLIYDLT